MTPAPATGAELVAAVRAVLAAHADPRRAADQQRYMKSAMPYHGLTVPTLRRVLRPVLAAPLGSSDEWAETVRTLWDEATHREEWYAALALARHRRYAPWRDASRLDLWRHLVVTGAWWDVVDETATHLVAPLLLGEPAAVRPVLRRWADGDDLWLRRTAILANVGAKERTDVALLAEAVEANLEPRLDGTPFAREFFLRKAIGWALRDYARTDPDWVRAFVATHRDGLSSLSVREATKHLA